jgi:SAM-dependent methyltransferase
LAFRHRATALDALSHRMSYHPHPTAPGYWQYDGLPVQADVETHQAAVEIARRLLPTRAQVLDVAAGHGALSKALLDLGMAVSCTSWNDRIHLPIPAYRIDLDHAFGIDQVGGRPFQFACAIEIIEHVENPAQLLRSLASVIGTGGHLVLSTPNVESAHVRLEWLLNGAPYGFRGDEITHNRHISLLWREGLERFIEWAGFAIVEKRLVGATKYHSAQQKLLKWPIHQLMRSLLKGDLTGNSRLYLMRRTERAPRSIGAEEVA